MENLTQMPAQEGPVSGEPQSSQSQTPPGGGRKLKWAALIVALLVVAGTAAYFLAGGTLFKGLLRLSDSEFAELNECVGLGAEGQDIYVNSERDIEVKDGCKVDFALEDDDYGKFLVASIGYEFGEINPDSSIYEVEFTGVTNFTDKNYFWNFGDGATSTEKNPIHTYTVPGIKQVSFSVEDEQGRKFVARKEVVVSQAGMPKDDGAGGTVEEDLEITSVEPSLADDASGTSGPLKIINLTAAMAPEATNTNLRALFDYTLGKEPAATDVFKWDFNGDSGGNYSAVDLTYAASDRTTNELSTDTTAHTGQVTYTYPNKNAYNYKLIITDAAGTELDQKHGQIIVRVGSGGATSYLSPFYSSVYHATLDGVAELVNPVTAEFGDAVKLITYDKPGENVVYMRVNVKQWDLDILGEAQQEECSAAEELRDILDAAAEENGDLLSEVRQYNEEFVTEVLRIQTDVTEILAEFRELIQKFITVILTRETDIKDFVRSVTPEEYMADVEELLGQMGELKTLAEEFTAKVDELLSYLKRDLNVILREEVIHRFIGDPGAYSEEEISNMLENAEISETGEGSLEVVVTLPSGEIKVIEVSGFEGCDVADGVFNIDDEVEDMVKDVDDTLQDEKKFITDLIDKINGGFDDFIADGNTCKFVGDILKAAENAAYHAFDEAKLPPLIVENYNVKPEQTVDIYDPSKHPNVKSFEVYSTPKKGTLNNEVNQYKANADFSGFDAAVLTLEPKEKPTLGNKVFGRDMKEVEEIFGNDDKKNSDAEKKNGDEKNGAEKTSYRSGSTLAKAEAGPESMDPPVKPGSEPTSPTPKSDPAPTAPAVPPTTDPIKSMLEVNPLDPKDKDLNEIFGLGLYCFAEDKGGPICGNSKIEQGEQCDDGNKEDGDGCNAACATETSGGGGGGGSGGGGGGGGGSGGGGGGGGGGGSGGGGGGGLLRTEEEEIPDIITGDITIEQILSLERFECLEQITPVPFPDTDNKTVNILAGIGYLEKAIVEGRIVESTRKYAGNSFTTRAEGAKMLMVASCTPFNLTFQDIFDDIGLSDWHYPYIGSARKLGLVQGYFGNVYRPNQDMTRAEAIKVMAKIMGLPETDESCQENPFVDIDENHWAYNISHDAFCNGITAGKMIGGERYLFPDEKIDRYEMATLVFNAFVAEYNKVHDEN